MVFLGSFALGAILMILHAADMNNPIADVFVAQTILSSDSK